MAIRSVLYWKTIPKVEIVWVWVDFSKISNTKKFNKWLIQAHYKQHHITRVLWIQHFNFPIFYKRFTLSFTMIKFCTFSACSLFRNTELKTLSLLELAACTEYTTRTDCVSKEGKLLSILFHYFKKSVRSSAGESN